MVSKVRLFNREPPYTKAQIGEQIGIIAELQKQRDRADNREDHREYDSANRAISVAQQILEYMLIKVKTYQERK